MVLKWDDKGRSLDQIAMQIPSHMMLETCSNKQLTLILSTVHLTTSDLRIPYVVYRPYTTSVPGTVCLQET